jgi:hypothetical protein
VPQVIHAKKTLANQSSNAGDEQLKPDPMEKFKTISGILFPWRSPGLPGPLEVLILL